MELEVVRSSVRWYPRTKSHDCMSRKPMMNFEEYALWDVVYVYIETTTYRSDIQAFILVTCYTDVFTAGKR
jgi:hypothetical protein